MKLVLKSLTTAIVLASIGTLGHAATIFNNADGANNYISTPGNWDNGLPTGGANPGTISVNAGVDTNVTHSGYDVTHTAGLVSRSAGLSGLKLGAGTTWLAKGTASYSGVRGIQVSAGGTYTQEAGVTGNFSNNNRDVSVTGAGSAITINGGTFTTGRSLVAKSDGTVTVNDGTVSFSVDGVFGGAGYQGGNGTVNLNGGSVTAQRFGFQSGSVARLGGSSVGTASFEDWGSGNGTNSGDRQRDQAIHIDLLSGTQVSLTLESTARALNFNDGNGDVSDAWAEALWKTDRLFHNGNSSTDLGLTWAQATNPGVGLGGGEYFVFTGAGSFGGTLSLAFVPEPGSLALLGIGTAMMIRRRR